MDGAKTRTIGQLARLVREAKHKSLPLIAELTGIGESDLDRIERGERPLNLADAVALARALGISPSDLTRLPVPAPANGHTDSTIEAVRRALDGVELGRPGGLALPVAALRDQVTRLHAQRRACRFADVATDLAGLIRNLHTSLATGTDHGELLSLAVYLHVHVTRQWLAVAAAPTDLVRRVVFLTKRLAEEHDTVTTLGLAGFAVADTLLGAGAFQLGRTVLGSLTLPPTKAETAGLACWVTMTHARAAVLNGRPDEATAPMDTVAELGERFGTTGQADALGIVFGPTDTGVVRMAQALDVGEPDRALSVAQDVTPERHPFPANRAYYWIHYGSALAQLPDRHDDAVRALRTAEDIYPIKVHRDPFVRDVIAVLLSRSQRNEIGQELQRMAFRAGLLD